jgi:hypothetical protein
MTPTLSITTAALGSLSGLVGTSWVVWEGLRQRHREQLISKIAEDYPQEIQEYGGLPVLRDAVMARELVRILETRGKEGPVPPSVPSADNPPPDASQAVAVLPSAAAGSRGTCVEYQGHTVALRSHWAGSEKVFYDGRAVASGLNWSLSGKAWAFVVEEDGQQAHYELTSRSSWFSASIGTVRRNGRIIYQSR